MTSIRVFLVAVTLATILLFNFVSSLQGYRTSMAEAEALFDTQLIDTTRLIASLYEGSVPVPIDHARGLAFQVWRGDTLLARSSNAPATPIADPVEGFAHSNFDGYRWRTYTYFEPARNIRIFTAERTDLRFTLAENLVLESLIPNLLSLPVVGLLIWWIVSQGLRPLNNLARELHDKRPEDLSAIQGDTPRRELEQIVQSINQLLARLDSSLQRERQFASDAAHELRTPISALKIQLYNLSDELSADGQSVDDLTETADRLSHLVDQILDLYRSSAEQLSAEFTDVDIAALTRDLLAEEYGQFERKRQQLEYSGEAVVIRGDRFALTTLLRNLLSNANKYTPVDGNIRVAIVEEPDAIRLTVEDSGPGIPEEDHEAVFERFYRVGGDRHASGEPGCGLGLAIVKHIVDLHEGSISIRPSRFQTGAAFTVAFPRRAAATFHGDARG